MEYERVAEPAVVLETSFVIENISVLADSLAVCTSSLDAVVSTLDVEVIWPAIGSVVLNMFKVSGEFPSDVIPDIGVPPNGGDMAGDEFIGVVIVPVAVMNEVGDLDRESVNSADEFVWYRYDIVPSRVLRLLSLGEMMLVCVVEINSDVTGTSLTP